MSRNAIITIFILLLILIVAGYFAYRAYIAPAAKKVVDVSVGEAALGLDSATTTYTDRQGEPVSVEIAQGSVLIVHSWASWVPSSPESLQDLANLQNSYSETELQVLAINRSEPDHIAEQFLKQINVDSLEILSDTDDHFYSSVAGTSMPETVFFDADGRVLFHIKRPLSTEELEVLIDNALHIAQNYRQ